jgi:glucose/mannose transport system substrate-binding protein
VEMRDSRIVEALRAGVLTGRLSRRSALKRAAALGLSVPAVSALLGPGGVSAQEGSLEVFSWWTSPGEAPALEALFETFLASYPDVEIVNAAIAGGGGGPAQAVLQTRLQGNNPPDAWQTHIGRELFDGYVNAGYSAAVTNLYEEEGWADVVPEAVVDQVTADGEQYAVPVGVHRGNGMFYNRQVLADNGIEIGETLSTEEFFEIAEQLQEAGVTPVAMGTIDAFVAAQYFENELLAAVGPDSYNALFEGELAWDDEGVYAALDNFGRTMSYVNSDHPALSWDGATEVMILGNAAFNSMGDWAYGEVVARDAVEDVGWVSHPGTAGSFVLVVDCFTIPENPPNPTNAENWLRVIGGREAQEAFNPLKGSIPARTDIDESLFAEYGRWSIASFASDSLVPSVAHGQAASPAFKNTLYDAAATFLVDLDPDTFIQTLVDAQAAEA